MFCWFYQLYNLFLILSKIILQENCAMEKLKENVGQRFENGNCELTCNMTDPHPNLLDGNTGQ